MCIPDTLYICNDVKTSSEVHLYMHGYLCTCTCACVYQIHCISVITCNNVNRLFWGFYTCTYMYMYTIQIHYSYLNVIHMYIHVHVQRKKCALKSGCKLNNEIPHLIKIVVAQLWNRCNELIARYHT